MHMLFLNVYAVERAYGGPQEGGWWYNYGIPLASVPMPAEERPGHDSDCHECNQVRAGVEGYSFCKQFPDDYDERVEDLARDLYLGSLPCPAQPSSESFPEPHPSWGELPQEKRDAFENRAVEIVTDRLPIETHLVPADPAAFEAKKAELATMFAEVNHGNIYSVLGGREVQIWTEECFAEAWTKERPRYE